MNFIDTNDLAGLAATNVGVPSVIADVTQLVCEQSKGLP